MAAIRHFGFSKTQFLVGLAERIRWANVHYRNNFHQNWSDVCGDIAINGFQNGGCLPSWFSENLNFCTVDKS